MNNKCDNCEKDAIWFVAPLDSKGQWCNVCVPRDCKECNAIEENEETGEILKLRPEKDRIPCVEIVSHYNMNKKNRCKHESPSHASFCDDCGKFVYYVYCTRCDFKGVESMKSGCPDCGGRLEADQVE